METGVIDVIRRVAAEVEHLMEAAFASVGWKPQPGSPLDQLGLRDGRAIVDDYLEHNEFECALHHLRYMVEEPPLHIPQASFDALRAVASSCGLGDSYVASIDPTVLFGELPLGWDLERVARVGVDTPALLPLSTHVVEDCRPLREDYVELRPKALVKCGGLVLVWDADDGEWHIGQVDDDDASVVCWASCGPDLGRAIAML